MKHLGTVSFALVLLASVAWAQAPQVIQPRTPIYPTGLNLINSNFLGLYNGKTGRWSGMGPPGSFPFSVFGDQYTDRTGRHVYNCYATPCTAVGPGNWQQTDTGSIGTGITSLNGDLNVAQTITRANDTNVIMTIVDNGIGGHALNLGWQSTLAAGRLNSNVVQAIGTQDANVTASISAQTLTILWASTLSKARQNPVTVYTDQTNTYGAFVQDFHLSLARMPERTVSTLPSAASSTGYVFVVTDGTSASDCTVGGASTAALCRSNGGYWSPLGGSIGGGASANFPPSGVGTATITIGAGSMDFAGTPCTSYTSGSTVVITAGSGGTAPFVVYLAPSCQLVLVYGNTLSGMMFTLSGFGTPTSSASPAVPKDGSWPVAHGTINTAGPTFASIVNDTTQGSTYAVVPGTGLVCDSSGPNQLCKTDDASVPRLSTNNVFTGQQNFANASAFIPHVVMSNSGTTRTVVQQSEIFVCTGACTITPLVPASGTQLCVQNDDNISTGITLAAISGVQYEVTARTSYKTANTSIVSTGAIKDQICIVGRDATHYNVWSSVGTWN